MSNENITQSWVEPEIRPYDPEITTEDTMAYWAEGAAFLQDHFPEYFTQEGAKSVRLSGEKPGPNNDTTAYVDAESLPWLNRWQWYWDPSVEQIVRYVESGRRVYLAAVVISGLDDPYAVGRPICVDGGLPF